MTVISSQSAQCAKPSAHQRPNLTAKKTPARAELLSLGFATPELCQPQDQICTEIADLLQLKDKTLARWRRIVRGAHIDFRHAVQPIARTICLSTAQRMHTYAQLAPPLAHQACQQAIERAGVAPEHITDLIVVSCTGFSAPGVDAQLITRLSLPPTVRRSCVGFMGCFGAITGLRAAAGACALDPNALALVVCVELCSLHIRAESDLHNQIASALFSDGAAAAIVAPPSCINHPAHRSRDSAPSASRNQPIAAIHPGASLLIPEAATDMTWTITDTGFAMTLTRDVPPAIERQIGDFLRHAYPDPPASYIIHPGGPGILTAVQRSLNLTDHRPDLLAARHILRHHGNMSSSTILFVLDRALKPATLQLTAPLPPAPLPGVLLAFGPGLTIETLSLSPTPSP